MLHPQAHSRSDATPHPVPSASSPLRNSKTYLQAIWDLNNLVFTRMRNVFYWKDIIYRLTPEGRWNHQACHLAHQHTGCTLPSGKLPSFIRHIPKGLALTPQAESCPSLPLQELGNPHLRYSPGAGGRVPGAMQEATCVTTWVKVE